MQNVTLFCFFASYLCALALEAVRLLRPSNACRWIALGFSSAGLLAHTIYLVVRSRSHELPPLMGSTHDWLLVLAWTIVLTHILVNLFNKVVASGVFFLPMILVLVGAARYASNSSETERELYWWGMAHASFLVLGIVGAALSLPVSAMYLLQHRKLRSKVAAHEGVQLFSLETLGRWNWWLVAVSVPLLTLGMACGVALSVLSSGTEQAVDLTSRPFLILGGLWLLMIALFTWLVTARRVSGRVIALRTAIVCGVFLAAMLVLQVFSKGGVHGRDVDVSGIEVPSLSPATYAPITLQLTSRGEGWGEGASESAVCAHHPGPLPHNEVFSEIKLAQWGRGRMVIHARRSPA